MSELANTLNRKFSLSFEVVAQAVVEIRDAYTVIPVTPNTIAQALALAQKYRYSYYDIDIGGGIVGWVRGTRH